MVIFAVFQARAEQRRKEMPSCGLLVGTAPTSSTVPSIG